MKRSIKRTAKVKGESKGKRQNIKHDDVYLVEQKTVRIGSGI